MTQRRRALLFLVLMLGLAAGSIVAIALRPTVLGLDLQGGVSVTLQCRPTPDAECNSEAIDRSIDIVRNRVDRFGVSEPEIQKEGSDRIDVALAGADDPAVVVDLVKPAQLFFYDFEANLLQTNENLFQLVRAAQSREPVEGGRPPVLYVFARTGDPTLACGAPGARCLAGPESAPEEADARKSLEERFPGGELPAGAQILTVPRGYVIYTQSDEIEREGLPPLEQTQYMLMRNVPGVLGDEVDRASQSFDQSRNNAPVVAIDFTGEGQTKFREVTRDLARRGQRVGQNQSFAVVLDGEILTTPTISFTEFPTGLDPRNGVQIEGNFTVDSARTLASQINSGALPVELEVISQREVGATLGKQSLRQGLIAGAIGLVLVAVFLLAYYRLLGVIAVFALLVYGLFMWALVELIPITLTLPGIAGVILTIGVASDANVVVFERAREEARAGKSTWVAVTSGYRKAFSAIIDANLVTFFTALILFLFSTAGVKGFAFALGVGVLLSLFTAYLATRAAFDVVGQSKPFQNPTLTGINMREPKWKFDIVGKWKLWLAISFVPLLIGSVVIGVNGLNLGLDFESGTRITTAFERQADENGIRDALSALNVGDAKIQATTQDLDGQSVSGFRIQTESLDPTQRLQVENALDEAFGIDRATLQVETVGPTFGREILRKAIIAIVLSFLLIIIYLTVRFEIKFAIPALISVVHDVWLTVAIYSLVGQEVTSATVAAILTILGYSLYDVVIVFDRIRENVPLMRRSTYREIVNRSVHETLNRSMITAFLTLLPVVVLLFAGGETLKDFAFALTVGLLSGGISSLAIAAPIAALWKEREPEGRRREVKRAKRISMMDADIADVETLSRAEESLDAPAVSDDAVGPDLDGEVELDEPALPATAVGTPDAEPESEPAERAEPAPKADGAPPEAGGSTPPRAPRPPRQRRHQNVQRRRKK